MRRYEATPPAPTPGKEADLNNFPLRLVKLELDVDPNKKGWNRFKISIPTAIRARYADDAIYGGEWQALLTDFDKRLYGLKLFIAKINMCAIIFLLDGLIY